MPQNMKVQYLLNLLKEQKSFELKKWKNSQNAGLCLRSFLSIQCRNVRTEMNKRNRDKPICHIFYQVSRSIVMFNLSLFITRQQLFITYSQTQL
jgi:hypothetical protein